MSFVAHREEYPVFVRIVTPSVFGLMPVLLVRLRLTSLRRSIGHMRRRLRNVVLRMDLFSGEGLISHISTG